MRYCGMDVSDKSSVIHVIEESGATQYEGEIQNDADGLRKYFEGRGQMVVGIEACGVSAWLAGEIGQYGHDVKVLEPQAIKALTRGSKTDKKDARVLAQVLRGGWYREVHQKSKEGRLIRSLVKARGKLVDVEMQVALQIQGLMKHWGIHVGSSQKVDFYERVTDGLKRMPELGAIIMPLLKVLMDIRDQFKVLDRQIEEASRKEKRAGILMTAPGVGPVTAMAFLSTIDEAGRFERSRQVGAYLGLTARVFQSGESEYYGRITRRGDRVLRGYLLSAAHVLLTVYQRQTKLKAWGLRIAKRKGYSKAKVAVARRLAVIMHRMLVDGREFDYALA